jgi:hypothetical protein
MARNAVTFRNWRIRSTLTPRRRQRFRNS